MNYTLQLHGERVLYPVPSGLYELMSDVTREVLRDQPSMLYQYIAHYMDTLVRVREYSRTASKLVYEVTQENVELMSYANSLLTPYEEVDQAARIIQRSFRAYRAKNKIKTAYQDQLNERSLSESFQEFLKTYDLDQETADSTSEVIQRAYRAYQSKKAAEERRGIRDASTHTIESISLKPPMKETSMSREKKPPKRDSKLLVYQQPLRDSVSSSWSNLARDFAEKKTPFLEKSTETKLVYEQTDDTASEIFKMKEVSEYSVVSGDRVSLPSYYDETQPKIPMISESGLLVSDDTSEIVTLFSTDSVDENQRTTSETVVLLPSLSSPSPATKPEDLAKDLFDIIGNKTSSSSKSRIVKSQSGTLNDDLAKTGKEPSVKGSSSSFDRKNTSSNKSSK